MRRDSVLDFVYSTSQKMGTAHSVPRSAFCDAWTERAVPIFREVARGQSGLSPFFAKWPEDRAGCPHFLRSGQRTERAVPIFCEVARGQSGLCPFFAKWPEDRAGCPHFSRSGQRTERAVPIFREVARGQSGLSPFFAKWPQDRAC